MNTGTAASDARRAKRRVTYAPSTLRVAGTRPVDVVVYDISETGIRFACEAELEVGDELSIGIAGFGTSRAYVAWAREGQYGCDFVVPISSDAAATAFQAQTVVRFGEQEAAAAPAPAIAVQVDQLYARHRRWAFPRDAVIAFALVALAAAALLWLRGG